MTSTTWHTVLSCISNQALCSQISDDVYLYVAYTVDLLFPPKDLCLWLEGVEWSSVWISYHLACVSSMMGRAMFNQAVLIEVLAVAVWAGESEAIWHWTVGTKQKQENMSHYWFFYKESCVSALEMLDVMETVVWYQYNIDIMKWGKMSSDFWF